MAKPKAQIHADLPADLHEADELLQRYGQWAMDRGERRRCGSVEGNYQATGTGALEARRTAKPVPMKTEEALRCQRALTATADRERVILTILYVPQRMPMEMQLRLLRIPPQLSQMRHLAGIRMFWNRYKNLLQHDLDKSAASGHTIAPPRKW